MDERPAPPIRLPVFYAAPLVVLAIAYIYDLTVGGAVLISGRGIDMFAIIVAVWCALEAVGASIYLVRRRYVAAAMVLAIYLLVFAAMVIGSRTFIT